MYRTDDMIVASKVARFEPRRTGRTIKMIMSLPSFDEYEGTLYLVGHTDTFAKELHKLVRDYKGEEVASRCVCMGASAAFNRLRGVDPLAVHIDHVALEYGSLRDVKFLYSILDMQNELLTF